MFPPRGESGLPRKFLAALKSNPYPLLLGFVIAAAILLRMYGLDWDYGFSWSPHPDERFIVSTVANGFHWPTSWAQFFSKDSPLNPASAATNGNFAYGSLPFYLLKLIGAFVSLFDHNIWGHDLYLVGRALSALFDTGTVLLVYFIGKRLFSKKVGLLASALVAFAVLNVQLSHFFTVDSLLAFFVMLTIYFCVGIMQKADTRSILLAGVSLGLALATKISAAPLALAIVTAFALYCATSKKDTNTLLKVVASGVPIAALAASITFAIAEPYAFLDYGRFIKDTLDQSGMARGTIDYPYTRQYLNTTPYVYEIQQSITWALGLFLGIAAWAGVIYSAAVAFVRRRSAEVLLLSWIVPYFLIIGSFRVKYLRYLLPMVPVMCIMAAAMLFAFRDWLKGKWKLIASGAIAVVVITSMFYAVAYDRIYSQPHTAVAMSQWINAHVPAGSVFEQEHWEEGLPNMGAYVYEQQQLPVYDDDSPAKAAEMAQLLNNTNYLVFFSNRLYGTIPRLPQRYPMTGNYYRLLFSGQLGFKLVDAATSYPNLFGVTFVDDTFSRPGLPAPAGIDQFMPKSALSLDLGYADESFTVYDNPKVMLFQNVGHLSTAQIQQLLMSYPAATPSPESQLMMSPAEAQAQQSGGTWSDLFSLSSLPNQAPVLFWLLVVELFSVAAMPLTIFVFRSFVDRGYILAKTIGILIIAYLTWLAASAHLLPFSWGSIFVAFVALSAVSGLVLIWRWSDVSGFVRSHWKIILISEALFIGAFLIFYGIRIWNPDLWHPYRGGEKPMDFAFLNAVVKSTYMPPYDPWFSGGYMNYYYFGQFIVATLIKFTGIVPSVAYNLAVPLLFALTVANSFCVVFNLVQKKANQTTLLRSAIIAGLVGAAMVAVLGNLDGMVQLVQGAWQALVMHLPFPAFDYWRSSRVSAPSIAITEFPFFTFLFADLHAHLIALPFTVSAIALALAVVLGVDKDRPGWKSFLSLHTWLILGGISLVLGALRVTNTWDFPTYLLLTAAAVLIAEYAVRRRFDQWMLLWAGIKVVIVLVLSYVVLFLPFDQSYQMFYSGVVPSPEKTHLYVYLVIHGLFLFIVATFLRRELDDRWNSLSSVGRRVLLAFGAFAGLVFAALLWKQYTAVALIWVLATIALALLALELSSRRPDQPLNLFALCLIGLAFAIGIGVDFITLQGDIVRMNTVFKFYEQAWVLLALASGYLLWLLVLRKEATWWRKGIDGKTWFGFLIGLAFVISIGVELFTLKGDTERMNTLSKFYLQAWVLFALASGCLLWLLAPKKEATGWRKGIGGRVWFGFLVFLILSAAVYPVAGTRARAADRFGPLPPTGDGMAYMKTAVYHDEKGDIQLVYDYEAIRWMQENIQGSPVIIEGLTPFYRWGARVSIYTGLPTVFGWDWHERQQRWDYQFMVDERIKDVNDFYTTTDVSHAMSLLDKYGVKYVYVGRVEQLYYPASGIAKFAQMAGNQLTVVYHNEQVTIYQVK